MSGTGVLVVGSYPPALTAGAAVTLDVVRDLYREGKEPIVASPRTSAAPLAVAVAGPLAGRRLGHLKRHTGATELVFVLERDLPVPAPPTGPPGAQRRPPLQRARHHAALVARQRATMRALVPALAAFDRVALVVVGDLGVPDRTWSDLAAVASTVDRRPAGPSAPGVTALGPDLASSADTVRMVGRRVAQRALGRRYGPARALAVGALHKLRAAKG